MNKVSIIIESILAAAVIALFVLVFMFKPETKKPAITVAGDGSTFAFAYINLDSVTANYQFAIDASDKLQTQYEDTQVEMRKKESAFGVKLQNQQKEAQDFQEKVNANAFLSRERAESEMNRIQANGEKLQKEYEALQQLAAQKGVEFEQAMQDLNIQLRDSLDNYVKEYNEVAGYDVIFIGATILTATEGHDITNEVVDALNARYKAE
jgi:outer membrane protein